jgi:uncharacterized protein YyaL (SSP411 family)
MANRLALESSPYLLQHANNPVDWFPWGEAAFERARTFDRPIFLSIGYSTCHWCHVMERESFESPEIAAVLNEHFVSIKMDREERPDVDRVYMTFVQATTGQGGWPMSVWLTPDLRPFYGGTYFPPRAQWGRPGFVDVLLELARVWTDDRPRILASANVVTERLRALAEARDDAIGRPSGVAGPDALTVGAEQFRRAFDARHGGFGGAPKFPRPAELAFLLREFARTGETDLRDISLETFRAMALGGLRDHVGGGFHRYSVDERWRVPHFEKMLYDQAQLALAGLECAQASGEAFYSAVAEDTLAYVARDLTHPDGGFFSAEDADSIPSETVGEPGAHVAEGAFYIWSESEVNALFDEQVARVLRLRFGIEPNGNAPVDPQGEFTGKNLLYTAATIEDIAARTALAPDEIERILGVARQRMLEARSSRPRPHLDDKVLTSWNGLMLAAFARAGRVLGARWIGLAERGARFVRTHLWDDARQRLRRRWRAGQAGIDAYCEDYAALIWGLLELVQATGDPEWLEWALTLQERQDALFWDDGEAGWFNTTGEDGSVLLRLKEDYDGAEPSATSLGVRNLLEMAHLVEGSDWPGRAERTLARLGPHVGEAARALPFMMGNLSAWHAGRAQVVIVGRRDAEDTRVLQRVMSGPWLPFTFMLPIDPERTHARLAARLPWTRALTMRDGRATAYVCRNFTCDRPVSSPDELSALLAGER